MKLHKALKQIVQIDEQDLLKDVRLVNILDDLNAFQDIPSSKYILIRIYKYGNL